MTNTPTLQETNISPTSWHFWRWFFLFPEWYTPWEINMEPTHHPFRKEHDLPKLHDYVPCWSSGVYVSLKGRWCNASLWTPKGVKRSGSSVTYAIHWPPALPNKHPQTPNLAHNIWLLYDLPMLEKNTSKRRRHLCFMHNPKIAFQWEQTPFHTSLVKLGASTQKHLQTYKRSLSSKNKDHNMSRGISAFDIITSHHVFLDDFFQTHHLTYFFFRSIVSTRLSCWTTWSTVKS